MIRKREGIKRTSGAIGTGVERERASFIFTKRKSERRKENVGKEKTREARERGRKEKTRASEEKTKEREKTWGNAELPKNGGEILRGRLKSRIKKSAAAKEMKRKGGTLKNKAAKNHG